MQPCFCCKSLPSSACGSTIRAGPCSVQACTIALPGFLQPWKRQVLVAGLQLRLLRGLPTPLCQLAADLSSAATAEAAALYELTGVPSAQRIPHCIRDHSVLNFCSSFSMSESVC